MKKAILFRSLLVSVLMFSCALPSTDALFSPEDHPKGKLIEFITTAKKKIYAAVYMLTDNDIVQALVVAKQRGVDVQMVVDPTSVASPYAKVFTLLKSKIPVFVFDTKQHHAKNARMRTFAPLMHNKFAVIDGGMVWTGSFNWTVSANSRNQENVIITDDKNVCKKYEKQFDLLVQRSQALAEGDVASKENSFLPKETSFWSNPLLNVQKWLKGE